MAFTARIQNSFRWSAGRQFAAFPQIDWFALHLRGLFTQVGFINSAGIFNPFE